MVPALKNAAVKVENGTETSIEVKGLGHFGSTARSRFTVCVYVLLTSTCHRPLLLPRKLLRYVLAHMLSGDATTEIVVEKTFAEEGISQTNT